MSMSAENEMSAAEFDTEYQRIIDIYGANKGEWKARPEQELARFFHRAKGAGWTQECIAERVGKSPQRIAQQLKFGAFLDFSTRVEITGLPMSKLCEKDFRRYWQRTDKGECNDNVRFKAVLGMLEEAARFAMIPARDRVAPTILQDFASGKYHKLDEIQAKIDHPADLVKHELDRMVRGEYRGWRAERKPTGNTMKYRFFPAEAKVAKRATVEMKLIASTEIDTELGPIVEILRMEGKKNSVTISPMTVSHQAVLLQRLLDKWT
jgi:hypothetical protein